MTFVIIASSSAVLLILLQLDLISGLQQVPIITSAFFTRRPTSLQQRSTCRWLTSDDFSEAQSQQITYDWDGQFEELQSFMSEYGHCNFPQNPSKQLQKKFPMLKRFCHDQRIEYKLLQERKRMRLRAMSLAIFDRYVCCRRLEELGFEFSFKSAPWYDRYHELIQYSSDNGNLRVAERDNEALANWVYKQRSRRSEVEGYSRLSDSQINLLDDIGFEWESGVFDEKWNSKYEELVEFRNEHGDFMVEWDDPLYHWMFYQRQRRAGKKGHAALTDEQIRLLDEIGFPWKPEERYDAKWYAVYEELKRFQKGIRSLSAYPIDE